MSALCKRNRRRSNSNPIRYGAALIELAVCLPVFFMITMATVETCRMVYLRQSLKMAAYETARLALIPGVKTSDLERMTDIFLKSRKIKGHKLTLSSDPETIQYGDMYTVTIEVPSDQCAIVSTWFYRGQSFKESVTAMIEY